MSKTVNVQSVPHFHALTGSSKYLILDLYADWCGPCKQIAPFFEQLSSSYSAEKAITFAKVNIDQQPEIARRYQVSSIPTFLVIKDGNVVETIRGGNPPALRNAVTKAREEVAKSAEEEKKKQEQQQPQPEVDGKTVSGGYTLNSGSNWKMSLK